MAGTRQRKGKRASSRGRGGGRRNRKKNEVKVVFPSPLAAILVAAACLSLAYLWFCGRCDALGKEMTRLERRLEEVQGRVLNEEFKWTNMRAPGNMENLLARHRLVMRLPGEQEVIRVRASAPLVGPSVPSSETPAQYAQRAGAFMHD